MVIKRHPCHGRPDKWSHCRHVKYTYLLPVETTSSALMENLRATDDLKHLISNTIVDEELWYDELSDEQRKEADETWENHKKVCDECYDNPCE